MSEFFIDNSLQCKQLVAEAGIKWLYEACGEVQSQTKRNSRVKTSKTKGSYEYKVDEGKLIGYVGSNYDNAIWEEFGTGEYAIHGDGRKGGWKYKAPDGTWHYTHGKRANRPFITAYNSLKNAIQNRAKELMKGI